MHLHAMLLQTHDGKRSSLVKGYSLDDQSAQAVVLYEEEEFCSKLSLSSSRDGRYIMVKSEDDVSCAAAIWSATCPCSSGICTCWYSHSNMLESRL